MQGEQGALWDGVLANVFTSLASWHPVAVAARPTSRQAAKDRLEDAHVRWWHPSASTAAVSVCWPNYNCLRVRVCCLTLRNVEGLGALCHKEGRASEDFCQAKASRAKATSSEQWPLAHCPHHWLTLLPHLLVCWLYGFP